MIGLIFRLLLDSVRLAFDSLINNKLRTFLSLMGISIGIFCIISVMTVIDSLERSIRDNVSSLGNSTIYIQKWPWSFGSDYPWWKYMKRPVPSKRDYEYLKSNSQYAKGVAFVSGTNTSVEYDDIFISDSYIQIVTHDFNKVRNIDINSGRYFSETESLSGQNVAIIGASFHERLFNNQDNINKTIKIAGNKVNVIGALKKEGDDMIGLSSDYTILIPYNYARNIFNLRMESFGPEIHINAKEDISINQLNDELEILMRSVRRLKPMEENDFAPIAF